LVIHASDLQFYTFSPPLSRRRSAKAERASRIDYHALCSRRCRGQELGQNAGENFRRKAGNVPDTPFHPRASAGSKNGSRSRGVRHSERSEESRNDVRSTRSFAALRMTGTFRGVNGYEKWKPHASLDAQFELLHKLIGQEPTRVLRPTPTGLSAETNLKKEKVQERRKPALKDGLPGGQTIHVRVGTQNPIIKRRPRTGRQTNHAFRLSHLVYSPSCPTEKMLSNQRRSTRGLSTKAKTPRIARVPVQVPPGGHFGDVTAVFPGLDGPLGRWPHGRCRSNWLRSG
jgi:hypothetical protein